LNPTPERRSRTRPARCAVSSALLRGAYECWRATTPRVFTRGLYECADTTTERVRVQSVLYVDRQYFGRTSTTRFVTSCVRALQTFGRGRPNAGQRFDGVAVLGVEIHILAPAARFEHVAPRPTRPERLRRRAELEVHFFARSEDGECPVLGGNELRD